LADTRLRTSCHGDRSNVFRSEIFSCQSWQWTHHRQVRKEQTIFSQGDAADAVFYIQKGKVKLTVVSEQGKEAVVAIQGPDEFCGEGCLTGQPRRMATAAAMTECEIMRLEKGAIVRALHDEPAFSEMFVAHLLSRTIRVEEDLVDQLFNSSEKRLARALLLLANFGKEGRPEPVIANVSQETLAEMIGTTRSRVSFFMNKFRRLGFIDYNGTLEVHSSLLSVVLHEKPHIKGDPVVNDGIALATPPTSGPVQKKRRRGSTQSHRRKGNPAGDVVVG
jgi:CRP/FNR family cyclic AMP-dependent transcriptional regulator